MVNSNQKPIFLDNRRLKHEIEGLKKDEHKLEIFDTYLDQLKELFLLRNPRFKFDRDYHLDFKKWLIDYKKGRDLNDFGSWIYYPWLGQVVHLLDESEFLELRTGRNKNLITEEEQQIYYNTKIGILGLSVGSHIAETIAMTGGAKKMNLADYDILSGSNLNRLRTGINDIGLAKSTILCRKIYRINPYSELEIFDRGISDRNVVDFLTGDGGVDILVEEMDNPYYKIKVREVAKKFGIPVIMATDNGDNIFVDIERFDNDGDLPLLNGLAENITSEDFKDMEPKQLPKMAAKIAGADLACERMQNSVLEVGKSLYSWPQLGTAANLCGSAVAFLVRKIAMREDKIKSGRYEINLDAIFESDYNHDEVVKRRQVKKSEFKRKINYDIDSRLAMEKIIEAGVYAPSGDNSQPWRFEIKENKISLFNLPDKDIEFFNFNQYGSHVAHGAALENMIIAAREFGYNTRVKLFPDETKKDLIFEIEINRNSQIIVDPLYEYIFKRATNRKKYYQEKMSQELKNEIKNTIFEIQGVNLLLVEDEDQKSQIAQASSINERVVLTTPKLHKVFFEHVVWSKEEELSKKTGLFVKTLEMDPIQEKAFKMARNWNMMKIANKVGLTEKIARQNAQLYASCSCFALITSNRVNRLSYIQAGRVTQRVWLKAVKHGWSAHPVSGILFLYQRIMNADKGSLSSENENKIKQSYDEIRTTSGMRHDEDALMILRLGRADEPSEISSRKKAQIKYQNIN